MTTKSHHQIASQCGQQRGPGGSSLLVSCRTLGHCWITADKQGSNSPGSRRDICQPVDTGGSRVPVITRPVMPGYPNIRLPVAGRVGLRDRRQQAGAGDKSSEMTARGWRCRLHTHSALGLFTRHGINQSWWYTPAIPACRSWRQEGQQLLREVDTTLV